ncbi:MAG: hypothetical protein ACI4U9_05225 [Clostridia bacterium]
MKSEYKKHNVGAFAPSVRPDKGITLIALIITIIVMLILASVTISIGTGNIENSKMISFVSYMQTIQKKVDIIVENENYSSYGEELTSANKSILQNILNSENESFLTTQNSTYLRYFDSNHIATDLEVENVNDEIVVDFNTREVISLNGIKYEGKRYYTQYYLPGGQVLKQQTEEVTRTVSFGDITSNIDGLNATFTITNINLTNGTLSYGKMDSNNIIKWTTLTDYTKKGENITTKNITESGKYYFKLVDNTTGQDNADAEGNYPRVELRLTNTPKLQGNLTDLSSPYNYSSLNDSTKWAFATDSTDTANLAYYVWIPRFAYKLNASGTLEELQFLRGTSDVTSSGGYINATDWTVPDAFTSGGIQRTGVWVKVDSPAQTRHRYN